MVLAKLKDATTEIKDLDDLLRVVNQARNQEETLVILENGAEIVVPASRRPRRPRLTPEERAKADEEAFLAAAGSWQGLGDPEELKRQIYAARGQRPRHVDRPHEE
jgi:hypothetical protein